MIDGILEVLAVVFNMKGVIRKTSIMASFTAIYRQSLAVELLRGNVAMLIMTGSLKRVQVGHH